MHCWLGSEFVGMCGLERERGTPASRALWGLKYGWMVVSILPLLIGTLDCRFFPIPSLVQKGNILAEAEMSCLVRLPFNFQVLGTCWPIPNWTFLAFGVIRTGHSVCAIFVGSSDGEGRQGLLCHCTLLWNSFPREAYSALAFPAFRIF